MPDLETAVDDHAQAAAEPGTHGESGGGDATAIVENQGVQPEGQQGNAEGETTKQDAVDPALEKTRKELLQDYHTKTQALADERRRLDVELSRAKDDAGQFQKLMEQSWFQKAIEAEKARRTGLASELSEDQFEALKSDPRAFRNYVLQLADGIVQERVGKSLTDTQKKINSLEAEREFEIAAADYPEIRELNKNGALDEYLQRGKSFEEAYKLYKFDHEFADLQKKIAQRTADVQSKRAGSVAINGVPKVNGGTQIIEASNLEESFNLLWDSYKR